MVLFCFGAIMKTFLQPLMALAFLGLVFAIDTTVSCVIARSVVRAVFYGIAAIFLLLIVVIALFGI